MTGRYPLPPAPQQGAGASRSGVDSGDPISRYYTKPMFLLSLLYYIYAMRGRGKFKVKGEEGSACGSEVLGAFEGTGVLEEYPYP